MGWQDILEIVPSGDSFLADKNLYRRAMFSLGEYSGVQISCREQVHRADFLHVGDLHYLLVSGANIDSTSGY